MTLIYNYLNIIIQKDLKGTDGETKGISLMNTKQTFCIFYNYARSNLIHWATLIWNKH